MSYIARARNEYSTIAAIRMAARGYVSAKEIMHCAIIGAVLLAIETGQTSALTTLFEDGGLIGPKTRSKVHGVETDVYTLTSDGRQIASYILDENGLDLGRSDMADPVLRFDKETAKWRMGGDRKKDRKWKEALDQRDITVIYAAMNELPWYEFGKVARPPKMTYDVNGAFDRIMSGVRKAERDGKTLEFDVQKAHDQVHHMLELVRRVQQEQAKAHEQAAIRGLEHKAA